MDLAALGIELAAVFGHQANANQTNGLSMNSVSIQYFTTASLLASSREVAERSAPRAGQSRRR
jgi:hypothetical protein